jgi:hypothetical protein
LALLGAIDESPTFTIKIVASSASDAKFGFISLFVDYENL